MNHCFEDVLAALIVRSVVESVEIGYMKLMDLISP